MQENELQKLREKDLEQNQHYNLMSSLNKYDVKTSNIRNQFKSTLYRNKDQNRIFYHNQQRV